MKNQRYLSIVFDTIIKPHEIPAFRGAIAQKVGFDKDVFHNHRSDGSFYYRYPLIQYKQFGRHPGIICLDHSIDEIHHLFSKNKNTISISGRNIELKVKELTLKTLELELTKNPIEYKVSRWMALSQKNHGIFSQKNTIEDKIDMLERILSGNILSFAKGIEWWLAERFNLEILEVINENWVRNKNTKVKTFDLIFHTNITLPPFIGLGKGASRGFGVIHTINQPELTI